MRGFLSIGLALACLAPGAAHAQRVYRCLSAEGVAMYVDRPCERLGVAERRDPADPEQAVDAPEEATSPQDELTLGCPAMHGGELSARLQAAVASRDANALAALYLWSGLGRWDAEATFPRFDALIEAGVVGVVQVHDGLATGSPGDAGSAAPGAAATDADLVLAEAAGREGDAGTGAESGTGAGAADGAGDTVAGDPLSGDTGSGAGAEPLEAWRPAHPTQLHVQHPDGATTVFEVRRQAGCLWLRYPLRSVQELPASD